jgi:hypothetical protein
MPNTKAEKQTACVRHLPEPRGCPPRVSGVGSPPMKEGPMIKPDMDALGVQERFFYSASGPTG